MGEPGPISTPGQDAPGGWSGRPLARTPEAITRVRPRAWFRPGPASVASMPPLQGRTSVVRVDRRSGTPAARTLASMLAATCWPVTPGSTAIQSSAKGLSLPSPPSRSLASTSSGDRPSRASHSAQEAPAGPPPTMTES